MSEFSVDITHSAGIQVGDHNTQIFNAPALPTLDQWWSQVWLPLTDPPLTEEIVLAGRQDTAAQLRAVLDDGQALHAVQGDLSALELKAFIAAALGPGRDRAVFVHDAAELAAAPAGPSLVVLAAGSRPRELPVGGPRRFLLYGREVARPSVQVPRVNGDDVAGLLTAGGLSPARARALGTLARRGLEQLRRALTRYPGYPEAAWATEPDRATRRLALLGAFIEADRDLVAGFTGLTPAGLPDAAHRLAADPDTPLLGRLHDHWYLNAPEDAFVLIMGALHDDDLAAFATLATGVLGGTVAGSAALRRGVAETLVLMAVHGGDIRHGPRLIADAARLIVRDLLAGAPAGRWAALTDVIQLLAEAAPEEFLTALSGSPDWHTGMFAEDRTYPPVLWALEMLAGPAGYFGPAVEILARLAAVDPGGPLSNRPANSLARIFDCLFPQTEAARPVRLRELRRLLRGQPAVTRTLLLDLLPDGHVIRTVHPRPRFRAWPAPAVASADEAGQGLRDVAGLAVDDAGTDPARCLRLIPRMAGMSLEERTAFAGALAKLDLPDDPMRRELHEALRDLVARHREFAHAAWALPAAEVDALAGRAAALRPGRAADRHRWMFADDWPNGVADPGDLARRRAGAAREILAEGGLDAAAALADDTNAAAAVGAALPAQDDEQQLMLWLAGERPELAAGYYAARMREEPARRDDLLLRAGDAPRRAAILLAAGDPRWAWSKLAGLDSGTADAYWAGFSPYGLGGDFDGVAEAAAGLNGAGRFDAALNLIAVYARRFDSPDIAAQALIAAEGFRTAGGWVRPHLLQAVVDLLWRHRDAIGLARLTDVELGLADRLGYGASLPATSARLGTDPDFFAGLVAARSDPAYRALHAWAGCPGTAGDGTVDVAVLRDWVVRARELLAAAGLAALGDAEIGRVLAVALPSPPDPVWEVLEDVGRDDLDRAVWRGLFNKRGVTSRGLTDGGEQERALAEDCRELARQAADYPRARRLLLNLARTYARDARQEDDEAEVFRRGI
ncbi:hypothetical protein [Dactylosporangium sp. NPDC049140]|uniref:hypothetical protein n=1 Tax=Dactylosporangium sp. NPDC049140 TaxID=3155647 RepID=UPI0033E30DAC